MSFILSLLLVVQSGTGGPAGYAYDVDKPCLSVIGEGKVSVAEKATEFKLVLYADVYSEYEEETHELAEEMRKEIIKITKSAGGKEEDVTVTNINTLDPIEGDPYYRVEQDIQIVLKKVKDINKLKEKYLLMKGIQIGSLTPLLGKASDYAPAVSTARKEAVKNAKDQAGALASEVGVILGEPFYITEQITRPTYSGYETGEESEITVSVTIYYSILYKK